jgi:hypothetical protein
VFDCPHNSQPFDFMGKFLYIHIFLKFCKYGVFSRVLRNIVNVPELMNTFSFSRKIGYYGQRTGLFRISNLEPYNSRIFI